MRAFEDRLRRDALSSRSFESRCEPSEFGFGACHIRSVSPQGRRRCASLDLFQYAGAGLSESASARCPSVSCCHEAAKRCALIDLVQYAVRAFEDRPPRGVRPFRVATEQSDGALPSISSSPRVRVVGARLRRVSLPCRHEEDGALPSTSSGPRCVADVAIDDAGASLPVRPSTRRNRDVRPVDLELKLPNHRAGACEHSSPGALSVGRGPVRSEETNLHLTVRFPATSRRRWRTTFARLACHRPPYGGLGPVSSVLPRSEPLHRERCDGCGRRDSPMGRLTLRLPEVRSCDHAGRGHMPLHHHGAFGSPQG